MTTRPRSTPHASGLWPFYALAFALTWLLTLPLVLRALGAWNADLSPHWHALGGLGPGLAALLVVWRRDGRAGARTLLSALTRWQVGWGWALVALLSPLLLFAAAVLTVGAFGGGWPGWDRWGASTYAGAWGPAMLLLTSLSYGFGEELGWRGFALPRLRTRHGALAASALLTVPWALWHAPLFTYRYGFGPVEVVGFVLALLAGSVWFTALYTATGGSVLMTALWHTLWNVVNLVAMVVSPPALSLMSAFVVVAAGLMVWRWGPGTLAPTLAERRGRTARTGHTDSARAGRLDLAIVSACLAFLGLGALYGGGALMLAPDGGLLGLPLDGLHTALFPDYFVPGLVLFSLFGVGSLTCLVALWARPWPALRPPLGWARGAHWSWSAALGLGLGQLVWIAVQLLVTAFRAPLQVLCGGAGLLIVARSTAHLLRRRTPATCP